MFINAFPGHLPQGFLKSLNIDLVVEVVHIPAGSQDRTSPKLEAKFKLAALPETILITCLFAKLQSKFGVRTLQNDSTNRSYHP